MELKSQRVLSRVKNTFKRETWALLRAAAQSSRLKCNDQELIESNPTSHLQNQKETKGRRPSVSRRLKCQCAVIMSIICMLKNGIRGDG